MAINFYLRLSKLHRYIFFTLIVLWAVACCAPQPSERDVESFDFYRDYLATYYPKVFVMCREYFVGMTPQEFEKALAEVVTLITNKPWFYFVNRPQGFKITRYWELIADQLSWMSEFMRTAYCDPITTKIYLPTEQDEEDFWRAVLAGSLQQSKKSPPPVKKKLDEYLVAHNMMVFYDFYALTFDYWIKLFNEAVLMKSIKAATNYLDQLEYALEQLMRRSQTPTSEYAAEKLQHSTYEADYQEHVSTAKAVLEMLKQRTTFASYESAG